MLAMLDKFEHRVCQGASDAPAFMPLHFKDIGLRMHRRVELPEASPTSPRPYVNALPKLMRLHPKLSSQASRFPFLGLHTKTRVWQAYSNQSHATDAHGRSVAQLSRYLANMDGSMLAMHVTRFCGLRLGKERPLSIINALKVSLHLSIIL